MGRKGRRSDRKKDKEDDFYLLIKDAISEKQQIHV